MDHLIEFFGVWLARAYAVYGIAFLVVPSWFFLYLLLALAIAWKLKLHSSKQQPARGVPRSARLVIEIAFGLLNPVLYLAVISQTLPRPRSGGQWIEPLQTCAWMLLAAFWTFRLFGASLRPQSKTARAGVRVLLAASLLCVLLFGFKDFWLLLQFEDIAVFPLRTFFNVLRLCPLYLIPVVLLVDYLRSENWHELLLLPDRAARFAVAGLASVALLTLGLAAYRRSDSSVRQLVRDHRDFITASAARYDVDPRLIASIVYVTHRDQLSPFRGTLERLLVTAWASHLRSYFGFNPPDRTGEGADENPLLNLALDVSVGVAQIKPRTAQTATVLAAGSTPAGLAKPLFYSYKDAEPLGPAWTLQVSLPDSSIPVTPKRDVVAKALLDPRANIDTCALILALYQTQWETANPDWSLRSRPEILATLYQIGFARSKPHAAPRSNAFGASVLVVHGQPWLAGLMAH